MEEKQEKIQQTKKELFWEIVRFLLIGGLATVADYLMANLFYAWLLPPQRIGQTWALIISTAIGFCTGLIINWIFSLIFVFKAVRDKKQASSKKSFLIYSAVSAIGLTVSLLGMQIVKILPSFPLFGADYFLGSPWKWWIMKGVMTCLVLVWNYVGRKIFIFKS